MPLKALIFDFDGVIIDSETPEYQIWQAIFTRYGTDIPLQEWVQGMGSSPDAFDPINFLERRLGYPLDRQALKQEHRQLLIDRLSSQQPLPGIRETIQTARHSGLRLAVASSSGMHWITSHLDRLGLTSSFEVLCTSEDVIQVKPDPALYQLALLRLGILPDQAAAIEDSPNGIKAARAAGVFCVAVPTPVSAGLDLSQANLVMSSLDQLSLNHLIDLFNQA